MPQFVALVVAPVVALAAGLLFGLGLMISGMANPAKVLGFLDLAGAWDPSLAFVMAGAVAVGVVAFAVARRRARSWLGLPMQIPAAARVTLRLVLGSAAFGVGWGLAGFCPGPALVALGAGYAKAWGFVGAMIAGMAVFEAAEALRRKSGKSGEGGEGGVQRRA
ncbi:DUF6691 family protein [Cupriavidus sp. RAF12]|uniref:DUF6691 family protein n=1 Tax=Cupriavidus sp. RAF12 TaxID=3233050 RepID=UPI003F91E1ED